MATTVDERIVAAKFDASDFEKGVNKTLKKLDELKESLDFKEATKSVKELAQKTEVSSESMGKSLDKLTDRFTNFTGMIKQKILGGLADEVAGVFLTMERSVTNFIRSISTEQVSAGLGKYQQILTSIRVMVSSGTPIDAAYKSLDQLQTYVDQTSYSLTQMTDALSKMVASGTHVDVATKSVQGIANACADAGINAQDAQRAFFNLSQAYSKGKLEYTDYRSLELLNMTTKKFKQQLLEAAVASETLTKTVKKNGDVVYKTTNKKDKKVKAGKQVSEKNLTDMLRYDFVNTDVLNKFFESYYFSETELDELRRRYFDEFTKQGMDRDEAKEKANIEALKEARKLYGDIAVDAYLAAKEARSFTDVLNTIKDVVSTGWATTFQHLFGKLDEAKDFFTALTEGPLAEVVYKIGEYRNAILGYWDTMTVSGEGSGGKLLRQSILNITEALGTFLQTFLQILPGFDELESEEKNQTVLQSLGDRLYYLTRSLRDFTERLKEGAKAFNTWMNSPVFNGKGETRIQLIRKAFANLSKVFSIAGKAITVAFNAITRAIEVLAPVFDGLFLMFEKITEPLAQFNDQATVFNDVEYAVSNVLEVVEKLLKPFDTILSFVGEIGAFIVSMSLNTVATNISFVADAISLVLELITGKSADKWKEGEGVIGKIKADFEGIKSACKEALGALNEFFGALLSDVKKLLGLSDEANKGDDSKEGTGIFGNLANFFNTNEFIQKAKAWVDQAIVDIKAFIKSIPERVMKLGENIYDTIWHLFFYEKREDVGGEMKTNVYKTELGKWFDKVIKDVKEFVKSIPNRIISGIGAVFNWVDYLFNYIFGEQKPNKDTDKKTTDQNGKEVAESAKSRFEQFISDTSTEIKKWFDDLPNKISKAFKSVGNFFTKITTLITNFLFGKKVKTIEFYKDKDGKQRVRVVTKRLKSGFSKWLDSIISEVKKFITNIPEYIKSGIKGVGDIVSSIVTAIFGTDESKDPNAKVQETVDKTFLGIDLTKAIETIKDIGRTLFNQIARIFTGSEDFDVNSEWISNKIAEALDWIRVKADAALQFVLHFLSTIPSRIASIFTGEETTGESKEKGPIGTAIDKFGESIGKFIVEDLPNTVLKFIEDAGNAFDKVWDKLYTLIVGETTDKVNEQADQTISEAELSPWQKFVQGLGETIGGIFSKLPEWIAKGIDMAIVGMNAAIGKIGNWLGNAGNDSKIKKVPAGIQDLITGPYDKLLDATERKGKSLDESSLVTAIKSIGEHLKTLMVETIPAFISEAWSTIAGFGSKIWTGFSAIFSGDDSEAKNNEISNAVYEIGTAVKDFITDPEKGLLYYIGEAWKAIKGLGSAVWTGINEIFSGDGPSDDEKDQASNNVITAIRTFLTETLPVKIKEIWNNASGLVVDIWDGVTSVFTGTVPESERAKSIANITNGIKDIIESAINAIGNLFSPKKDDSWKKKINANDDMYKQVVAAVEDQQRQADDRLKEESKNNNTWSFVSSIGESLLNAFADLGPIILNSLSFVLNTIGDIAQIIVDALTGNKTIGEKIEEKYGKEKPELTTALKNIGESLKKFFLDTIPKLLGSAIGALINEGPKWFGKLFDSLTSAAYAEEEAAVKDAEQTAESNDNVKTNIEGATGLLKIVQDFLDKMSKLAIFQGSDIKVFAIIIGLTLLLQQVAKLFSAAEVAENVGYTIKWVALTVAFSALAGIMSYITSLYKEGDEEQIERVEGFIDKIGGLIDKFTWILGIITAGKLVGLADDIWGKKNEINSVDLKGSNFSEGILGFFNNILKGLGIGAALDVGSKMFSSATETTLNLITDSLYKISSGLGDFMKGLSPFVEELNQMDSKLDTAISAVVKIGDLFVKFYKTFEDLYVKVSGNKMVEDYPNAVASFITKTNSGKTFHSPNKLVTSVSAFKSELEERIGIYMDMATFIDKIATALNKLQNIDDAKAQFKKITDIINDDQFTDLFTNLFDKVHEAYFGSKMGSQHGWIDDDGKALTNVSLGLEMLSNALSVFGTNIADLNPENVKALNDTLDVFGRLAGAFDGTDLTADVFDKIFKGENSLSVIGGEIRSFGYNVAGFYTAIKDIPGFKSGQVEETNEKIASISLLGKSMINAVKDIGQYSQDFDYLNGLSEKLPAFGVAAAEFITALNDEMPELSVDRSEVIRNTISVISSLLTAIGDAKYKSVGDVIDGFTKDLTDERSEKLVTAISNVTRILSQGIQAAFDEDPSLQPTITPVLKMDEVRRQLSEYFGTDSNSNLDISSIAASVAAANVSRAEDHADYITHIDAVKDAIVDLGNNSLTSSDVSSAFGNMKIYLNTGALVGGLSDHIDAEIGRKIWILQRQGAVAIIP